MAEWLILGHLLNRQYREDMRQDSAIEDLLVALLLLPLVAGLGMPYLVWSAARDAGESRFMAGWWVSLIAALEATVAVLASPWWLFLTVPLAGTAAIVHIGVSASRERRKAEAAGYYGQ